MRARRAQPLSRAAVLVLAVAVGCVSDDRPPPSEGVIVEQVGEPLDSVLGAGDLLLGWSVTAPPASERSGELRSPFDLGWLIDTWAVRSPVVLRVRRGNQELEATAPKGRWQLEVRPRLDAASEQLFLRASSLVDEDQIDEARGLWRTVEAQLVADQRLSDAAWFAGQRGARLVTTGNDVAAAEAFADAVRMAVEADDLIAQIGVLECAGDAYYGRGDLDRSEKAYDQARKLVPGSEEGALTAASLATDLGVIAYDRGQLDRAEALHREALATRLRLAQGSLAEAVSYNNLGAVAQARGDLASAEQLFARALEILEAEAPGSRAVTTGLSNLGAMAHLRGDLRKAAELYARSLEVRERVEPGSLGVASNLNNLGIVAMQRGDLKAAEEYHRRALEIRREHSPGGLDEARSLDNLALVLAERGDLEVAEKLHREALASRERLAPSSIAVARSLSNLATLVLGDGRMEDARALAERALAIREAAAPESLEVARSLVDLATVVRAQGELDLAGKLLERSLRVRQRLAPGSLAEAVSLVELCDVAYVRAELERAREWCRGSLAIRERLAPGSLAEAESLHRLAVIERQLGHTTEALKLHLRALDVAELQETCVGGAESGGALYAVRVRDLYRDAMHLLLEVGRTGDAFEVLERSRARRLVAMLAARDMEIAGGGHTDLDSALARLGRAYERELGELSRADAETAPRELEERLDVLREMRAERAFLRERLRSEAPRLAELRAPVPASVDVALGSLDPGTLMLSYEVGRDRSTLFVLGGDGLEVHTLPIGGEALRDRVEAVRLLIQSPRAGERSQAALHRQCEQLFADLVGPAVGRLLTCKRVLVVPDGPLHFLPFAALVLPTDVTRACGLRPGAYLVELKPVHVVVSATVYAAQVARRPGSDGPTAVLQVAAFGDPAVGETMASRWEPLPATREEVSTIAALFAPGEARVFVGPQASEAAVEEMAGRVRYLHLACHAVADERFPLDSHLVLAAPPGRAELEGSGVLRAWEILERVTTRAELVTLSACETGHGVEMGGEGLIGLTRAFEHAGARSIVASLWKVSDRSTAALMESFYRHQQDGLAKDEALRTAQVAFIHGQKLGGSPQPAPWWRKMWRAQPTPSTADLSHPFYWAAFQLHGDWR
jgi:CHAT domain-containing protein/tetratricopeptide (TPR) repeat protein